MANLVPSARRAILQRPGKALILLGAGLAGSGLAHATAASAVAAWNAAFYSAVLTSLLVCMLINVAIRNPPGINYTVMLLLGLGFIWASDGGLAALGLTGHALTAGIATAGMVTVAFGLHTAVSAFDPRADMWNWRRVFYACAVAALLLIPVFWLVQSPLLTWSGVALFLVFLLAHAVSTRTWKHHDDRQQSMAVMASLAGLVLLGAILASLLTGYGLGALVSWNTLKLAFAVVMLLILSAVIFALADVRLSRDHALEEAVEAAQRDARTNASLLEMEKQYAKAREAAFMRSRQLSSASHDIRQPLASMRAELDTLRDDAPASKLGRLDRVLDHLEALTRSLSASGRASVDVGLHGEVAVERVEIKLLFDTLSRLFQTEAAQAGITLSFAPSPHAVSVPPLILIRMLSNLISNAIQHSGASTVSVTCQAFGETCRISVSDDGSGFTDGNTEWAMAEGVRGERSEGSGLGLSIIRELSRAYHLPVTAETNRASGTVFTVAVPLA